MCRLRIAFALLLMVLIGGCAVVEADVSRFHRLSPDYKGRTFTFMPVKGQKGSIEFATYINAIGQKLKNLGFIPASNNSPADYGIFVNYSISGGKTVSGSTPMYGQTGGGTTTFSGTGFGNTGGFSSYSGTAYTPPTYGVVGSVPYSYNVYTRVLTLDIVDLKKSTNDKLERVFEGRVTSTGSSGSFSAVANCLIIIMFEEFPGKSGTTRKASVDSSTCVK